MNTRNVVTNKPSMSSKANVKVSTQEQRDEAVKKSTEYYNKNAKPGSLAAIMKRIISRGLLKWNILRFQQKQ